MSQTIKLRHSNGALAEITIASEDPMVQMYLTKRIKTLFRVDESDDEKQIEQAFSFFQRFEKAFRRHHDD